MKEKQETDKEKWERELNELEPEDGVFTVTEWKWTLEQREAMKKIRLKRSSERDKFMSAEPKCYTRHCKH